MTEEKKSPYICLCNEIPLNDIEQAIARGCHSVAKIGAATTAGAGQCGGSCQPRLKQILEHYLATGAFLAADQIAAAKRRRQSGKK